MLGLNSSTTIVTQAFPYRPFQCLYGIFQRYNVSKNTLDNRETV